MNHPQKAYSALIGMLALGTTAVFAAQSWNPVISDRMNNTAMGSGALANPNLDNDGGCHNTASGADTLTADTSGSYNSATGFGSLFSNLTGDNNTGLGAETLYSNRSGSNNTASGYQALYRNAIGSGNTALGAQALYNTVGSNNIAIGMAAGLNLTTGHSNIDIGAAGASGESGNIRIGTAGTQTGAFIAGISGTHITGAAVYVTSAGQLGVLASSERYKTAITTMGPRTEKLSELRPVTFRLKNDPKGDVQYGLIAEEVAKVYPELVIRDGSGRIEGVRYDELAPMLLNEVQKQQTKLQSLEEEVAQLKKVSEATQAAIAQMRSKDQLVAER